MLCTTMDLESVNFSPILAFQGLFKQVSLETLPLTLRWKVAFLGAMTEEDSDLALCLMNDALHCLLNPKLMAEGWFESSRLFNFFVAKRSALVLRKGLLSQLRKKPDKVCENSEVLV